MPSRLKSFGGAGFLVGAKSSSSIFPPRFACRFHRQPAAIISVVSCATQSRPPGNHQGTTMRAPLMPKATAVSLVENTALTFHQIDDFCGLHPLEVQAIADVEVANQMQGLDPVANGQTTAEAIARCQADSKS